MTHAVKDFEITSNGLNSTHRVVDVNTKSKFATREEDYGEHDYLLDFDADMLIISELDEGAKKILHIISAPYHIRVCDNIA